MILVRLYGGLGNQMFQYAFGYALSKLRKEPLFLDIREFDEPYEKATTRVFELDKYKINASVASKTISNKYKMTSQPQIYKKFRNILSFMPAGFLGYYKERDFCYDSGVLNSSRSNYFDGYWQSYKYFDNFRDEIIKEFQPLKLDKKNMAMAKEITSCNSVSLHVRRGDYITNPHAQEHHGICSLDYYYNAIKELEKISGNYKFFLFSDDPLWVQENLKISHTVEIIDYNRLDNAYIDMYLMSLCKNHIIANSSFSWWGAWLSNSSNKRVFAPKRWFNSNTETEDLILPEWIRI